MVMTMCMRRTVLAILCSLAAQGCTTFDPRPENEVPFKERAYRKFTGNVRVTVAVPSAEESRELFGVPMYKKGIQPVWIEIENNEKNPVVFSPWSVDPNYYTPLEAADRNHYALRGDLNAEMDRHFHKLGIGRGMQELVPPGTVRSGYIFTNLDEGTKDFSVELYGTDLNARTLSFFIPVPGLKTDHRDIHWEYLYPDILTYDEDDFRKWLEELPCCTTNQDETGQGDPLNLIVIGDTEDVFNAFLRAGWDETETIYWESAWKTVRSFLVGGRYRYSPVSSLYVFGREQDVAFQKARDTIHERNHLRLWMAPIRFKQKSVWVGQISRDIGVRLMIKKVTTHKIDPDVDETRGFLIQDLAYSQGLAKFAFVKGVDAAPITNPRANLTGDPYFTDGYRAVLWVSADPVELEDVKFLGWEKPDRWFKQISP